MNEEDRFLERLRSDAKQLRFEPADDVFWNRLSARIRERISVSPPSVAELLSRWIRPVVATFSAIALAGIVTIAALQS